MSNHKNTDPNSPQKPPIFVVGMPRSGTTLISRLLSAHSSICIAPESHLLNYWMQRFPPEFIDSAEGFQQFWDAFICSERFGYFGLDASWVLAFMNKAKVDAVTVAPAPTYKALLSCLSQQYAEKRGKQRWGEKTPAHYAYISELLDWYPHARIIYMVRDPRSVAASMAKVPWGGDNVIAYALRWQDSIAHLQKWARDTRVLPVHYEALVTSPEPTLSAVCDFVEASFEGSMLSPTDEAVPASALYASKWAASHFSAAAGAVNTDSLKSWEKTLSKTEIALVEYLTKGPMGELGYDIVGTRLGVIGKLRTWLYLVGKQLKKTAAKRLSGQRETSRNWA